MKHGASSAQIPQLDGIRGLAILFVLAFHARAVYTSSAEIALPLYRLLDLGWSGVDLFFVLSGFLITGILLDTRESESYFRTFYVRRFLRIFPLYSCYIFFVLVVVRVLYRRYLGQDYWASTNAWWYVSYLLNWKADHGYNDLFLGHLWSLAIEEQFYLIWPLVVWLCPRRWLPFVCLFLAGVSLSLRFHLYSRGVWPEAIYRLTPTRMDGLALGAFAAVGIRDFRAACSRHLISIAAIAAFAFLILFSRARALYWGDPQFATIGTTLLGTLYACFVFAAATTVGRLSAFLKWAPLREIGKYSYAMYVLHSIPYNLSVEWMRHELEGQNIHLVIVMKALYIPALIFTAFGTGWASWWLLESRVLKLKRYFTYHAPDDVLAIPRTLESAGPIR